MSKTRVFSIQYKKIFNFKSQVLNNIWYLIVIININGFPTKLVVVEAEGAHPSPPLLNSTHYHNISNVQVLLSFKN